MYCTVLWAVSVYVLHCVVSSKCICTALYCEQYVYMYCSVLWAVIVYVLHCIDCRVQGVTLQKCRLWECNFFYINCLCQIRNTVLSPSFVQVMHTNYYKIINLLKSFDIIIVSPCFVLHKPSSGSSQPVLR